MILLDTHVLVWMSADPKRLSRNAMTAIKTAQIEGGLAISAISLWELAVLFARGRIQSYGSVETSLRLLIEGISVRAITPEIAALAALFPDEYPRDPADRIIGATARAEGMPLITRDANIRRSSLLRAVW